MQQPQDILQANLAAMARTQPQLAEAVAQASPLALTWSAAKTGQLTAQLVHEGKTLRLASQYDPAAEADKLLSDVDYGKHAGLFVLGMGLGHHVARAAGKLRDSNVMLVFEPSLPLLRAVLERIDHSQWLGQKNVILMAGNADRAALIQRIERFGGTVTQGSILITHPPSRQLHGEALSEIGRAVTDVLAYLRTNVATGLVNAARTVANLSLNLPYYAAGAWTDELHNVARGYPAVCVGAGPSLAKNVHLLQDPAVRRNVIVISAQTTLKPLLDRGIEPDFVTALDYHEISRRFYEGLPPLERVTLVAEPKANPAILDSFPGPIRVTRNTFLNRLMGDLPRPQIAVPPGATVAHLSFYLAQHLGCDPIMMIGQDLGFSDGLYYCPGTAIHDVWAPELGRFNTLEMMEWQRVVRHRVLLQKFDDVHGRPVYSDEQMVTYLRQFERDFAMAKQSVLDATEGGLAKQHTQRTTLAEALAQHATRPVPKLPLPSRELDADRLAAARKLLRGHADDVRELRELSVCTVPILEGIRRLQRDEKKVASLFADLNRNRKRVSELGNVFTLVSELNTIGTFNRLRADRLIDHDTQAKADVFEEQRQRLTRDIENVRWLIQACDEAMTIFDQALQRVNQLQLAGKSSRNGQMSEVG